MKEILELIVSWTAMTSAIFAVILLDERRLSPARLERTWPPSSRDAAIVAFGIFSVPIHFVRTRRSVWGLVLGILWVFAVCVVEAAILTFTEWLGVTP